MPIPASQIVQFNPRLLTPGGSDLEFNGLLLSPSDVIPSSQLVLPFPDAESVGDYFGLESQEYQAAVVYFLGYDNSLTKPRALYIGRRVSQNVRPFIRGGAFNALPAVTLETLKKITNGAFSITISGTSADVKELNFSEATSLSDVAQKIQTALVAADVSLEFVSATVTYSSLFDAFTITGGQSGAEKSISFAAAASASDGATDVSAMLMLTEATGAILSQGMDAMTQTENMEALLDLTQNFVTFTTVEKPTQEDALAYAKWATGKGVNYLYIYWDDDPKLLQPGNTSTIAAALKQDNAGATCGVWNSLPYAAFIMGTAASIAWNQRNSTITFAFKAQAGLAANVSSSTDATNLEAQGMNFMGDYATRNDQFIFLYSGQMFGEYRWIDAYLNMVWLCNAVQVACLNGFSQSSRVPYNQDGYTLIKSWCLDPVNRARYAGIIDTGVALSESQKSQIAREAGRDISSELFNDGVVIQVGYDPDDTSDDSTEASVRMERQSPPVNIWLTYGGSVHRLTPTITMLS